MSSTSKPIIFTAVIVGIIAMFFVGYWYRLSTYRISTDNAFVETDLSPVNSRIMGFISEVLVDENQPVKKGDLLVKLDDVDSNLELSYKEAKFKKAESDLMRAEKLAKQKAISPADLEMAQAMLVGNRADMEGTKLKLKFTQVLAPIDGIVAKRSAQPGQFVQPGQSLLVIVPTDHAWIRANYKESQIRHIRKGDKVKIEVDAYPDDEWMGVVEYIYPSTVASLSLMPPENTTGNFTKVVQRFPVKISFTQKPDKLLKPGMSVLPTVYVQ